MEEELNAVRVEKDLGVVVDDELNFSRHLSEINVANRMVGLIRRTFTTMDESMFKNLFVSLVRPHLEYANQVWCPYKKRDIAAVEAVQRRATKMVPGLRTLTYPERLKKLGLPTLTYRRSRGGMIETFRIITGVYDEGVEDGCVIRHGDVFLSDGNGRTQHMSAGKWGKNSGVRRQAVAKEDYD
ncbi:uncharacterized protein LOC143037386 [Oratosquilla oratoria]|uniref:uncharacterized protein LOC143037386 n=1 Tax=Oratosquilla oratoria TaxID=337810 RepID=UPI003F763612